MSVGCNDGSFSFPKESPKGQYSVVYSERNGGGNYRFDNCYINACPFLNLQLHFHVFVGEHPRICSPPYARM